MVRICLINGVVPNAEELWILTCVKEKTKFIAKIVTEKTLVQR
jgi:hypothetical protein